MSETVTGKKARKQVQGEVISNKAQKTIVVKVTRRVPHPRYKKIIKVSKRFYAHDANSEAQPGDIVEIAETRPLSKLKRWELIKIVKVKTV
ncbi:MAG: 30S ribosomal protein S17 [Verrucomicrobiales bacterium]|jgi:small subunit ribosomal protein S17|nr:30S ribosomal protein S17 [Verrucomicrobiales bacterium]